MRLSTVEVAAFVLAILFMGASTPGPMGRAHAQVRDPFVDGPVVPGKQKTPADEPGYLGITVDDRGPGDGIRIVGVTPGGPADKAGLKTGDLITAIGSMNVRSIDDFAGRLAPLPVGAKVSFQLARDGETVSAEVVLGRRQAATPATPQMRLGPTSTTAKGATPAPLGVRVQPVNEELQRTLRLSGERGVHIARVTKNSAADKAGIPADAVILAIDGHDVGSPEEAAQILSSVRVGQSLTITLNEAGSEVERTVVVEPATRAASLPSPGAEPPRARPPVPAANSAEAAIEGTDDRVRVLERRLAALEEQLSRLNESLDKFRDDVKQLRSNDSIRGVPPNAVNDREESGPKFRLIPNTPEKPSP
jgi:predicted metalloprotease with PDZ domain